LQGVDAFSLASLRYDVRDHAAGAFAVDAPNDDVLEMTGRHAENFETTARRYAALPFTQPTLRNRFCMLTNVALIPFVPGYDFGRRARTQLEPLPIQATQCIDSERWRANTTRNVGARRTSPNVNSPRPTDRACDERAVRLAQSLGRGERRPAWKVRSAGRRRRGSSPSDSRSRTVRHRG